MKFRTDFVTNSSSESFFTVFTKHTDGSEKGYFGEDGQVFSKWAGTVQKEDGIYINEARISNKEELCAILLFGNNDEFEAMPLKALSALFLFLSEEIDCSELIERIQLLENTLDWSRYYYDGIRKTLGESYDFSILKEIDTESDDKEDIYVAQKSNQKRSYALSSTLEMTIMKMYLYQYYQTCSYLLFKKSIVLN